ncbi:hypothetical protein AB6846_27820 [Serratia proteamaculans]
MAPSRSAVGHHQPGQSLTNTWPRFMVLASSRRLSGSHGMLDGKRVLPSGPFATGQVPEKRLTVVLLHSLSTSNLMTHVFGRYNFDLKYLVGQLIIAVSPR